MKPFKLLCCAMLLHMACTAQDSLKNEKVLKDYLHSLAFEEYIFEAPGNDFEKMEDLSGYIRTRDKAAIKFLSVPGKPADFKKELIKEFIANKVSLFDSISINTSDGEAFAWWQEEIPLVGSGYPVYLSFSIVMPTYQHITLLFVGAYPQKEHEDLKARFIKSAFSLTTLSKYKPRFIPGLSILKIEMDLKIIPVILNHFVGDPSPGFFGIERCCFRKAF